MQRIRYNKITGGQAVVELAFFASLILVILATMLSYLQRGNDQQYVQMEAFRRALEKACTFQSNETEGAGASVQYTVMETRRHSDLSGSYRKGSSQSFSASSSVFWAIPKSGQSSESKTYYKINTKENVLNYRDYVPVANESQWELRFENSTTSSVSGFREVATKQESAQAITTRRQSDLQDNITTVIPYTIRAKDNDDNPDNDRILESGELWNVTQGLYLDTDKQYKYSEEAVGTVVRRGREWQTNF